MERKWTKEPWYVSEYKTERGPAFQLESDSGGIVFCGTGGADHDRVESCVNAMGGYVRIDFQDDEGDPCYKWEKRGKCIQNPAAFVVAARELAVKTRYLAHRMVANKLLDKTDSQGLADQKAYDECRDAYEAFLAAGGGA